MFRNVGNASLPDYIDFPQAEREILKYWLEEGIFEEIQKRRKTENSGQFTFYDGPPFATGLPHFGHILAGTIKDIIGRYVTQKNLYVERRFGWDCHGLPVEYEIDKRLNIHGPEDVRKMGIAAYNKECRQIVQRYTTEWRHTVERSGRWVDFENGYKTMNVEFMESVWWVFKQLFDKGLVYRGTKVMPFSTACCTPLSNFESTQNYKDVTDVCVTVALKLSGSKENLLIWTTTPWTLPSNLSVCVNPKLKYVRIKLTNTKYDVIYILSAGRLSSVFSNPEDYVILEEFHGTALEGVVYEPLFDYFTSYGREVGAFRILLDEYVTDDAGTGIVHQAPYFGEDDYRVCLNNNIISKTSQIICPIDDSGRFTEEVPDLFGIYFKDANDVIVANLKKRGNILKIGQVKHSYPFCWRSDTPLIYKSVPSWFINVESLTDKLIENNSQTYWVPKVVKEKRFANWLANARDWAVSRNRYWGTPIPIWSSESGDELHCVGSKGELESLSGVFNITDLHREYIDDLLIPSKEPGKPRLRRVPEVFDCWFESGAMPCAQQHYPFENKEQFLGLFPADFIAEGIDQTRGWFYTLLVISTALFEKPPFKNVIVNGLVLAEDGLKISKRKRNYVDPVTVMEKYGADALRLYLVNSPLVKGGNLCFKENGVKAVVKTVLLPCYNALRFCMSNIEAKLPEIVFEASHCVDDYENIMDCWILSYMESFVLFFETEMKAYRLYTVIPRLVKFIEQLTNWYIRLNRSRIKGDEGQRNCEDSLRVLLCVLAKLSIVMAPFAPYFSEYIYQRVVFYYDYGEGKQNSVHGVLIPPVDMNFIQPGKELTIARMQTIVDMGRVLRERHAVPIKYPLAELVVVHLNAEYLSALETVKDIILKELNVRKIRFTTHRQEYGAKFKAEPQYQLLGQRLKSDLKEIAKAIKELTDTEIEHALKEEVFYIRGKAIHLDEIKISFEFDNVLDESLVVNNSNDALIIMDMNKDVEFFEEGTAREIINRIQKLKKKAKLYPTEKIIVFYETLEERLRNVITKYAEFIYQPTQSKLKPLDLFSETITRGDKIIEEIADIKGLNIAFHLYYED